MGLSTLESIMICAMKGGVTMEILDTIKQIVADQLAIDEDEVIPGASFIDDLGADSLDIVELIMALEEEFDMEIPDEDAEKITTVQNVVDYIKSNSA